MNRTKFYRGYVVTYDPEERETYETACCYGNPHTSWQVAEECARRVQRLYGGNIVTREVRGEKRRSA